MTEVQTTIFDDIEKEIDVIADDVIKRNIEELNEQGIQKRTITMHVWQWIAGVLLKNLSIRFYWKDKEIFRVPSKVN